MPDTFSRDDLATYGKERPEDTVSAEAQTDETDNEDGDEAAEVRATRPTAEQAEAIQRDAAERAVELVEDEEIPDLSDEAMPDEAMPDLSDPDIEYDSDKLREKTGRWVKRQMHREMHREITATKLKAHIDNNCAEFAKTHKDWNTVVRDNPVLQANQLHPLAGAAVGASKYVAQLLYAFGKDTAYAARVAAMTPGRQLVEVGKLKQKVAIENQKRTATATVQRTDQGARQTLTRKVQGPASRDEQMKPGTTMSDFVQRERQAKQAKTDASRRLRGLK
jgi:hypothetical protein